MANNIYFYTIHHDNTDYSFDCSVYGCAKVAMMLGVEEKDVTKGSVSTNPLWPPDEVLHDYYCPVTPCNCK